MFDVFHPCFNFIITLFTYVFPSPWVLFFSFALGLYIVSSIIRLVFKG